MVDFGTNRKRVCNFLLVINNNLGPILPRFRDIAGFPRIATPPLFHPNFRRVPFGLDWRCCGSEEREEPKLIIRVINFELVQRICPRYINVTDRRPDRRTTYDSNTALAVALRASRGNNTKISLVHKSRVYTKCGVERQLMNDGRCSRCCGLGVSREPGCQLYNVIAPAAVRTIKCPYTLVADAESLQPRHSTIGACSTSPTYSSMNQRIGPIQLCKVCIIIQPDLPPPAQSTLDKLAK